MKDLGTGLNGAAGFPLKRQSRLDCRFCSNSGSASIGRKVELLLYCDRSSLLGP